VTLSLFETIQRIVQEEVCRVRTAELAVVQDQHPHASDGDSDNYACTVRLRNSGIMLKQVPVATPRIGHASIPAVGNLVLVQFVGGDVNAPIITGSLYNDEDRPPPSDDGQAITHLPLGASDDDALRIELHSGDRREIVVKVGSAIAINVRDDDPVVVVDVDGGSAKVQIDRDGAITVESTGDLTLKAGGTMSLEANEVNIEARSQVNVKGATINLN